MGPVRNTVIATLALVSCGTPHEPSVSIISPEDGAVFSAGDAVGFVGEVLDEDGDIEAVTWTSSVDGPLGDALPDAGGRVSASATLSPGAHVIVLSATDADGSTATDEVNVSVGGWPLATITSAGDDAVEVGVTLTFEGTVSDPDEPARDLTVTWQLRDAGGVLSSLVAEPTDASGHTSASWVAQLGTVDVVLTVRDADDHEASDEIAVSVLVADDIDHDGDGHTVNEGDCADDDDARHPGAPEDCDGVDDDCDLETDDKDDDADGHVDQNCIRYVGTLPRDDCNDASDTVYPNAPEGMDAVDNDCDGEVDEGTIAYDDDGDCYCEDTVCVDSVDPGCHNPQGGDCQDDRADRNPGAIDEPDLLFDETNCDEIDGDVSKSVFVAPDGNDALTCLTPTDACATLASALDALTPFRRQILLKRGTYLESLDLPADVALYGGYDANWTRGLYSSDDQYLARISGLAVDTSDPRGWATLRANGAITLQNLVIVGPDAIAHHGLAGEGSFGLYADGGGHVDLELVRIERGRGAGGLTGGAGTNWTGARAPDGTQGGAAVTGACGTAPQGGAGASQSCGVSTISTKGGRGGNGGCPGVVGFEGSDADEVAPQRGHGGAGGAACLGTAPRDGQPGVVTNGAGGAGGSGGAWSGGRWIGGTGGTGAIGNHGGGGGGGGGAGGCTTGTSWRGAAGGGGGAGGCRSTSPGSGGGPGGASVGVYVEGGSLTLTDVVIAGGTGGTGGTGGIGGTGQPGGLGGPPGTQGGVTNEAGMGGEGGHGGHAGGGGGGAGGSVFGVVTVGASGTAAATVQGGTPGAGGVGGLSGGVLSSDGSRGQTGQTGSEVGIVGL